MNQHSLLCEHCGYPFDPKRTVRGPVICPACGLTAHPYGTLTGSPSAFVRRTPPVLWLLPLLTLLLLANLFGLYLLHSDLQSLREALMPPENSTALSLPEETNENRAEKATAADDTQAIQETPLRSTHQQALSEEDLQLYTLYAAKLDERYPVYTINDYVKLRQISGLIQRGQFIGLKDDTVLLLQNGSVQHILLSQLDRDSRIRIDPVFREKAIQFQMNKATINPNEIQPSSSGR